MPTPIESLKLSTRPYNALLQAGVETVEKLRQINPSLVRGIAKKGVAEIRVALHSLPKGMESDFVAAWPAFLRTVQPLKLRRSLEQARSVSPLAEPGVMLEFPAGEKQSYEEVSASMHALWKQAISFFETETFSIRIRYEMTESNAEDGQEKVAAAPREKMKVELPYPDVTDIKKANGRDLYKYLVNVSVNALGEDPDHPNRVKIEQLIAENKRIADMSDDDYAAHRSYEANPINKLTRDEKLYCIRSLPMEIVNKLFPHL